MRHLSTISVRSIFLLMLASTLGCASLQSAENRSIGSDRAAVSPESAPEVARNFETVEEAALAALGHIRTNLTRSERTRLQVGAIVRTESGYAWAEAVVSGSLLDSTWQPKVRVAMSSEHVATYLVHPRTGNAPLDRANERFSMGERRIVDEFDPMHRPMFLLTPSGRIVSYEHGGEPTEIADLKAGKVVRRAGASPRVQLADEAVELAHRVD